MRHMLRDWHLSKNRNLQQLWNDCGKKSGVCSQIGIDEKKVTYNSLAKMARFHTFVTTFYVYRRVA